MTDRKTVAVIGSGAVGSYYGARLAEAGHDVRFLMRRDYEAVRAGGLRIESPDGDLTLGKPPVFRRSDEIGLVDWVVCALKATSIVDAQQLVAPCVSANTRILVLMNGLGLEERFAQWFDPGRIFGGLAFVCLNRGEPGQVHHLAYGALTLAHLANHETELKSVQELWSTARVSVSTAPSLVQARWEKLCWNIPFNGLAVAAGAITTDQILADPTLCAAARGLMDEVIAAGNADLASRAEPGHIDLAALPERMFAFTETMGAYRPSTLIDFVEHRPMEIEAMFGEPLRRAQGLGVSTPHLSLLTALLTSLNAHA